MEKKGSDLEQCENIFKKIRTSDHWLTFKSLIKINVDLKILKLYIK